MNTALGSLLAVGSLLLATAATAQTRYVQALGVAPEAQLEVGLQGNDYLLGAVSMSLPSDGDNRPVRQGLQVRLGYEHFWNANWSAGATLRVLRGDNSGYGDLPAGLAGNVVPGLLLRHTSQLGKFNFGQRLGAEYAATIGDEYAPENRGLARLRLDMDRSFQLSEKVALRPRIAYEAVAYLRLQREEGQTKERVIDFGNLRGEVGLRLSPHIDITPWVAAQTIYINSLPQYDKNGVQVAGGRTNIIQPVAGLDLRFTLPSSGASAGRIQLPSQH